MIGSNNLWIAAHALAADAVLVTHNAKGLARIGDLKWEDWTAAEHRFQAALMRIGSLKTNEARFSEAKTAVLICFRLPIPLGSLKLRTCIHYLHSQIL